MVKLSVSDIKKSHGVDMTAVFRARDKRYSETLAAEKRHFETLDIFSRAERQYSRSNQYGTAMEFSDKGLYRFKRRIFPKKRFAEFFGLESSGHVYRSLDALADILADMKVVGSLDEGKRFVQERLEGESFYGVGREDLHFQRVENNKGEFVYKISKSINYFAL